MALLGLALRWWHQHASSWALQGEGGAAVGGVSGLEEGERAQVEVVEDEAGTYHVSLSGTFELQVDGQVEFTKRMLVVILGLLEVAGESRGSRRTRDGRIPFVRQAQLAAWFGVLQPHISLWNKYWLEQDWPSLLSQRWGEVLTDELQQRASADGLSFPGGQPGACGSMCTRRAVASPCPR